MRKTKHRGHLLRKGRHSESGRPYLITAVCSDRKSVFDSLSAGRCLAVSIGELEPHAKTWCFVAMPDHFHWLMEPVADQTISACVQRLKSLTTRRLRQSKVWCDAVWQRGFHDHAVREPEDLKSLARYVIANPVRAGLVERIGDYPHWDAAWL
ncbi:MAG: transposase [Pseudomonadota bacterium]